MLQEDIDDIDEFSDKGIDKIIRGMSLRNNARLCPHCILFNGKITEKHFGCSNKCNYMLRHSNCNETTSKYNEIVNYLKEKVTLDRIRINFYSHKDIIKAFNKFIVPLQSKS